MACSFHRKSARVQLPSLAGRNTYPYATALCPGCRASAALSRAATTGFFTTVSCVVRSTAVRCSAALPAATRSADMPSTALSTVTFPSDALVLNAWTTCSVVFSTRTLTTMRVPSCPEQTRAVPVQLPRLHRSQSAAERPDRAAPQAPCSFAALHRAIFVSSPPPPPECVEMCRFYLTVFRAVCQSFRQRFAPKFFSENWADSTILIVSGRERPLPAVLRVSSLTKSR